MAFNLFDFSATTGAKLNPLGNVGTTYPQASPQVGGATGGGLKPPTISMKPLPPTPIKKPSVPTFVPGRSSVDIRVKIGQNLPKVQEELKRQGVSDEDMHGILQNLVDVALKGTTKPTLGGTETMNRVSKFTTGLTEGVAGMKETSPFKEPLSRLSDTISESLNKASSKDTLKGVSGVASTISSPFSLLPEQGQEILSAPMQILTKPVEATAGVLGATPEESKDISNVLLTALPFTKYAKTPLTKIKEGVSRGVEAGKKLNLPIEPETPVIKKQAKSIESQIEKKAIDWEEPALQAKVGVKKSAQILKRGEDVGVKPSTTLVKNGILAEDHISNGNYDTLDVSKQLRNDTVSIGNSILRPALKEASTYTPRINVSDVVSDALNSLESKRKSLTADAYESQKRVIETEYKNLQEVFPEGLTLEDLYDRKITSDVASKFNPLGTIADNNSSAGHSILSSSYKKTLVDKVPKSIPFEQIQKEMSSLFKAADYAESLHGKKAPISNTKQMINYGAKFVGAKLGQGGGLVGSAVGYHAAGLLERMLENIPSPFKKKFIEDLAKTNPEIFTEIKQNVPSSKIIPENIESSVLQWVDKEGKVHYKVIKKGELNKFNVDKMKIAGKPIKGKRYHLTSKTPEKMDKEGAIFEGVAKQGDLPIITNKK